MKYVIISGTQARGKWNHSHGRTHLSYISTQWIPMIWRHKKPGSFFNVPWWRHEMETFSSLLAICAGNSPVPGEFPAQRPVTRSFDVFIDLRLNKRLSKQSWGWWFQMPLRPLWRHRNAITHTHTFPFNICMMRCVQPSLRGIWKVIGMQPTRLEPFITLPII